MQNPKFSFSIVLAACLGLASSLAFAEKPAREHLGKGNPFTAVKLLVEEHEEVRDINEIRKF